MKPSERIDEIFKLDKDWLLTAPDKVIMSIIKYLDEEHEKKQKGENENRG